MVCVNCQKEIPDGSQKCALCGASQLPVVATPVNESPKSKYDDFLASKNKRLVNYLIDSLIGSFVFGFILGIIFALTGLWDLLGMDNWNETILGYFILIIYYPLFEWMGGKTLGKLITKTKVVKKDGTELDFATLMKRTLVRFIPFEAFSYLGKGQPIGWHDKWSGTLVIDEVKYKAGVETPKPEAVAPAAPLPTTPQT